MTDAQLLGIYKKYTKIKDLDSKLSEDNHIIAGGKELIKQ
jgi:hypothetical protein